MRQWIVPRDTWWTLERLEAFARWTGIELVEIPAYEEAMT